MTPLSQSEKKELRELIIFANNPECKTIEEFEKKTAHSHLFGVIQEEQLLGGEMLFEEAKNLDIEIDLPVFNKDFCKVGETFAVFKKEFNNEVRELCFGKYKLTLTRVLVALGSKYGLANNHIAIFYNGYDSDSQEIERYEELIFWDLTKDDLFLQSEETQRAIYEILTKK